MKFIYSLGIRLYGLAILIASLFNEKAKKWRQGRENIFENIKAALRDNRSQIVWFHCASLGEFEQGRTVIEEFKQRFPTYKVLLTFFSPSGYELRKDYQFADYVFYLPLDTHSNAVKFLDAVKPSVVVFVKYEFWHNYLNQLHKRNIPVYLISALFRPNQYFFKWYGGWFKNHLLEYKKIFVQDEDSEKLLKSSGINNVELAGDTRIDRVVAISEQAKKDALVETFKGNNKLWICGSTWPVDEKLIYEVYQKVKGENLKLMIVPHEIGESHIKQVVEQFGAVKYSAASNNVSDAKVLVVDKMGLLASLYQYGDFAYIGGGFTDGIHSVLEAVVWGIPVVFGPDYHKFKEAIDLIKVQGGFTISNASKLSDIVRKFVQDDSYRKNCGREAMNYVQDEKGATDAIVAELQKIMGN